jgi:two-component system chemotaxis sensor kinase CheA
MSTPFKNDTFVGEVEELLLQVETATLALEQHADDTENVNLLFRALHTIKGSSAVVGLDGIANFAHHLETAIDKVRSGRARITPNLVSVILACRDHIHALMAAALEGNETGEREQQLGAALIKQLVTLVGTTGAPPPAEVAEPAAASGMRTTYDVAFQVRKTSDGLRIDPHDLLESLKALGSCHARPGAPADDQFEQGWKVELITLANEDAIRDVFIFMPAGSRLEVVAGLREFVTAPPAAAKPPQAAAAPPEPKQEGPKQASRKPDMVRVPSQRLDQLVKLVGELVINQSRLQQAHASGTTSEIAGPVEAMERLISDLRDSVFGIRMMPIGPTFHRFKRLARDLSSQLDKEIELDTAGDETELDKTVLDQLGDPLVHLIRNSMDHGIEPPADRVAKGKPPTGRVLLTAAYDGGQVVISIQDDGRGLNHDAIRRKAIEKGLIDPGTNLSESETFDLIMRPGFSTAAAVTQLSGRGVGMDVVKKTIEALRGTISISSIEGKGTTIRLSLPLTLAIIDGLVVQVEEDYFIVPMAAVTENVELTTEERRSCNGRSAVAVRGELVPYLRLRKLFAMRGPELDLERIVVVSLAGQRFGLVVDNVIGSHQTVIQPLGPLFKGVGMFSGTTIMGDGRVVMILDLAGTLRQAERTNALVVSN